MHHSLHATHSLWSHVVRRATTQVARVEKRFQNRLFTVQVTTSQTQASAIRTTHSWWRASGGSASGSSRSGSDSRSAVGSRPDPTEAPAVESVNAEFPNPVGNTLSIME
jgi:hypothetical protein